MSECDSLLPHNHSNNRLSSEQYNRLNNEAEVNRVSSRIFLHSGEKNLYRKLSITDNLRLAFDDGFHTLVYMPTWKCVLILLSIYVSIMFIFAVFWTLEGIYFPECNLQINNLLEGFCFSLESLATIGYGTESNDIFFGNCYLPMFTLLSEILCKLLLDSLIIGTVYAKISKGGKRAGSFIGSDFAIIRRLNGKLYFMFQFCDSRQHQLVSASMRLYAVHSHRPSASTEPSSSTTVMSAYNSHCMNIVYPLDSSSSMFMFFPQLVVHEIDASSPLMPPSLLPAESVDTSIATTSSRASNLSNGIVIGDIIMNNNTNTVESETYSWSSSGSSKEDNKESNIEMLTIPATAPVGGEQSSPLRAEDSSLTLDQVHENNAVATYIKDKKIEVIAFIDGTDAATGMHTQVRFSYYGGNDNEIVWNKSYVSCVSCDALSGQPVIDFTQFQKTVPAPGNVNIPISIRPQDIFSHCV